VHSTGKRMEKKTMDVIIFFALAFFSLISIVKTTTAFASQPFVETTRCNNYNNNDIFQLMITHLFINHTCRNSKNRSLRRNAVSSYHQSNGSNYDDKDDEEEVNENSSSKKNNHITDYKYCDDVSEKISGNFENGNDVNDDNYYKYVDDGDKDDHDSLFDDLFLIDENGENGPDANLNENDLMELHGIHSEILKKITHALSPEISSKKDSNSSVKIPPPTKIEEEDNTTETVSLDIFSSNLSYFYLRDELGLSEDVMWKITNHASSVLGLKASTLRNKIEVLQSLVGFTDQEIRQLITSNPALLQLSAKKNISPTILFWIRQLGIGKDELKTLILGCPSLLKYSRANISGKLAFFQTTMGYSLPECRDLLLKDPGILTGSVKTGLIPRLNFLHKEVKISLPDIRKIMLKNPNILRMSVDQNLQPKIIFYFIMTLRMETKDVGKMLLKYPQILNYNLEHHILPIHHYLLSLDFSTCEFSRILLKYPRVISPSLIRIKRQIGYFRFELCFKANAIRRILYQCPQIVSLGRENLEQTVQFLLQAVVPGATLIDNNSVKNDDHDDDNDGNRNGKNGNGVNRNYVSNELVDTNDRDALRVVQILLTGLPTLLGCSVEKNLEPKVNYLRDRLGQEELSSALLRLPPLLGYSLEKRIRPRLEQILEAGVPGKRITVAITLKEDSFHVWLTKQEIKYSTTVEYNEEMTGENEDNLETEDKTNRKSKINSRVIEDGGKIIHWRR